MLLQAQSAEEFKANCRAAVASNGTRAVVVTVSPQSRVSLAHAAGLNPLDAAARLTGFFKAAGATRVFDSSSGRDFALLESCEEFVTRYKARRGATTHGVGVTTHGVMPPTPHGVMPPSTPGTPPSPPLPVLTSACPGWVCYAEKTHGPETLRHISAVKSPQAIMGTIVKRRVAAALGLTPSAVYHATVMPCFDKKLEASRDDFRDADGVPGVDCVLTTGEVAEMLAEAAGLGDADGDPRKFAPEPRRWRPWRPRRSTGGSRAPGTTATTPPPVGCGGRPSSAGRRLGRVPRRRVSPRRARIVRRGSDGPAGV